MYIVAAAAVRKHRWFGGCGNENCSLPMQRQLLASRCPTVADLRLLSFPLLHAPSSQYSAAPLFADLATGPRHKNHFASLYHHHLHRHHYYSPSEVEIPRAKNLKL